VLRCRMFVAVGVVDHRLGGLTPVVVGTAG